jgi:cytochrome P450
MVAGLEPRIAEVTTELLDATCGGERLDLIESLAYPLPVIVIGKRPAGMVGSGARCRRPSTVAPSC